MVDPLINAVEVWLAIYNTLPPPIFLLINFSLGLFVLVVMFNIFRHIRG